MPDPSLTTPTPYPDLNAVLHELVTQAQSALQKNFVAAYLQGSFALGDFDQHSDVDFLIVTEQDITAAEVAVLQERHAHLYHLDGSWAKHLEGSYISRDLLNRTEAVGKEPLWYLDNGSRVLIRSLHDNDWVVRWVVRERGIVLAGPPARELLAPIPSDALRDEVLHTMQEWGQELLESPERMNNRWYQPFVVLNYCRMLQTLATGTIQSKRAGAQWGKEHLEPQWSGLIERAWKERPDPSRKIRLPADPEDLVATRAFLRYTIDRGKTLSASPPAE